MLNRKLVSGKNNYSEIEFIFAASPAYEESLYRIYFIAQHIPGKGPGKTAAQIYPEDVF